MILNLGTLDTATCLLLAACLLFAAITGLFFFFRKKTDKKGDVFFATLLFAFAFLLLQHVFILLGIYQQRPQLLFLPVYFTLSFGPLLFFSVKLWLFPTYRFVWSDLKHAILPLGQLLYFLIIFFTAVPFKKDLGRNFYSPFYGGVEMLIYILTFYLYLYSAYRYIRYKRGALRHSKDQLAKQNVLFLKRLVKVLFVLFWINSGYIVTDFVVYEILNVNLHSLKGFTRFGDLSLAAMVFWVSWNGWKNIFFKGTGNK
jgi:hypothetical protein